MVKYALICYFNILYYTLQARYVTILDYYFIMVLECKINGTMKGNGKMKGDCGIDGFCLSDGTCRGKFYL